MKVVWIFNEGSPGHVSQSIGFVDILKRQHPIHRVEVYGRTTLRGWQRHCFRLFHTYFKRTISTKSLPRIADVRIPDDAGSPDLIVSSGGKSVFPAYAYASYFNVPYVFIGERKPYPDRWFQAVFSPVEEEVGGKTVLLDTLPTPVNRERIESAGQTEPQTWCMIIGGRSRSYPFCPQDWVTLAREMNRLAEREKIQWLVTTSRRTGAEAEEILQNELNPAFVKDAIWWDRNPRRELYSFMARSEKLFVTKDSVTMVTEAIGSARPVITVDHPDAVFSKGSYIPQYYKRLYEHNYATMACLSNLSEMDLSSAVAAPDPANNLARQVKDVMADVW